VPGHSDLLLAKSDHIPGSSIAGFESIKKLVEEASALALLAAKEQSVQVAMEFDPSVDLVLVDRIQIQQVLLNLLRNAIEAMQATSTATMWSGAGVVETRSWRRMEACVSSFCCNQCPGKSRTIHTWESSNMKFPACLAMASTDVAMGDWHTL
jgi:hypothetical protein